MDSIFGMIRKQTARRSGTEEVDASGMTKQEQLEMINMIFNMAESDDQAAWAKAFLVNEATGGAYGSASSSSSSTGSGITPGGASSSSRPNNEQMEEKTNDDDANEEMEVEAESTPTTKAGEKKKKQKTKK